jgi:hypothetical protein
LPSLAFRQIEGRIETGSELAPSTIVILSDFATAAPVPLDAPMTTATLPVSLLLSVSFHVGFDKMDSCF